MSIKNRQRAPPMLYLCNVETKEKISALVREKNLPS